MATRFDIGQEQPGATEQAQDWENLQDMSDANISETPYTGDDYRSCMPLFLSIPAPSALEQRELENNDLVLQYIIQGRSCGHQDIEMSCGQCARYVGTVLDPTVVEQSAPRNDGIEAHNMTQDGSCGQQENDYSFLWKQFLADGPACYGGRKNMQDIIQGQEMISSGDQMGQFLSTGQAPTAVEQQAMEQGSNMLRGMMQNTACGHETIEFNCDQCLHFLFIRTAMFSDEPGAQVAYDDEFVCEHLELNSDCGSCMKYTVDLLGGQNAPEVADALDDIIRDYSFEFDFTDTQQPMRTEHCTRHSIFHGRKRRPIGKERRTRPVRSKRTVHCRFC